MTSRMRYGNSLLMQGERASLGDTMSSPGTRRFSLLGAGSACLLTDGFDDEVYTSPSQPGLLSEMAGSLPRSREGITDLHGHRSVLNVGTRAVNRLLLSLWFALLWALWPSNDWICLVVLSQAFFASARLLQAPTLASQPASSTSGSVMGEGEGESRAQSRFAERR